MVIPYTSNLRDSQGIEGMVLNPSVKLGTLFLDPKNIKKHIKQWLVWCIGIVFTVC